MESEQNVGVRTVEITLRTGGHHAQERRELRFSAILFCRLSSTLSSSSSLSSSQNTVRPSLLISGPVPEPPSTPDFLFCFTSFFFGFLLFWGEEQTTPPSREPRARALARQTFLARKCREESAGTRGSGRKKGGAPRSLTGGDGSRCSPAPRPIGTRLPLTCSSVGPDWFVRRLQDVTSIRFSLLPSSILRLLLSLGKQDTSFPL